MTVFEYDLRADNEWEFNSSAVDVLAYNRDDKTLYVEFKSGLGGYIYEGVEESTFNLAVISPSVGRFIQNHIVGELNRIGTASGLEKKMQAEPAEPVDLSPGVKWLTDTTNVTNLTIPVIPTSRYSVKWLLNDFEFVAFYDAMSEADALTQFGALVRGVGLEGYTIMEVTHYLG